MAWPPTIPPNTRTNATITLDNHPDDHNQTSDALTETVTEVNLKAPKANPVFTGVVTLPAGTAAAPALTWTGDTNTGLYSDTADTISFSTGGTLRMSIGALGIIGPIYTSQLATGTTAAGYNQTGVQVVGFGANAAVNNAGDSVTAMGYQAAYGNPSSGDSLTAAGVNAAYALEGTPGTYNTMIGASAGQASANHAQSTLIGGLAGFNANFGSASTMTAVGYGAGYQATGTDGIFLGAGAGGNTNTHNTVVVIGKDAVATAANQFSLGSAGYPIYYWVPGHDPNTYLDWSVGDTLTFVTGGTARGDIAGSVFGPAFTSTSTVGANRPMYGATNAGAANTALGESAGGASDYLQNSTLIGYTAGYTADMGSSLASVTAVGTCAGRASNGTLATYLGEQAGYSLVTPGTVNTMIGYAAGYTAANHAQSTLVGGLAGYNADLGSSGNMTIVGYAAGYTASGTNATLIGINSGNGNTAVNVTAIGAQTAVSNTYAGVTLIGYGAVATADNQFVVGSAGIAANTWHFGHDMDTYWDAATADTVKHYAGGVKVLEVNETGGAPYMGFFGTAAVAKPTGVAVSAAGIHAALVTLGLINT